ncbi:hypothetical protein K1T71_000554 [Dendrolimus kikuchii]|uniref:Uncharacterized protein n=1 Tax=Dendrolimus kikuchii TaxID=765133 RepID=A0ACC1DJX4_9NEOP|nr:hypothetical protein K1T71_000554 [Dendrolimus kikuchii]
MHSSEDSARASCSTAMENYSPPAYAEAHPELASGLSEPEHGDGAPGAQTQPVTVRVIETAKAMITEEAAPKKAKRRSRRSSTPTKR